MILYLILKKKKVRDLVLFIYSSSINPFSFKIEIYFLPLKITQHDFTGE